MAYFKPVPPCEQQEAVIPNYFAYFALFAWPFVCLGLFARLPVDKAAIWSLLSGYLLLPTGTTVDIALFPPIDKFSVTSVTTFLFCWMKGTREPRPKRSLLVLALAALFVISPIFTSLNNSYELGNAKGSLPGFYPTDAMKFALGNLLLLAPFFVGNRFLASDKSRETLLRSFPLAALCYSVPMLFEVRFSPQLHNWVYGYFPHSFIQQIRDGGFRPVVFLRHGLEVALFASLGVVGALVLTRAKWKIWGKKSGGFAAYLTIVLLLCKTLGAALYAILAAPLVIFCRPRTWLTAACCMALVLCAYPMLRTYRLIPVETFATAVSSWSTVREGSLLFRTENEDALLVKANQKPIFGWGSWGRNRVFDQGSGQDLSITDGTWIMQFGMFGWAGYLSLFGLFLAALVRAKRAADSRTARQNFAVGGLGLILALNLLDLIPNANLYPFTFLVAGSLAGRLRTPVKTHSLLTAAKRDQRKARWHRFPDS